MNQHTIHRQYDEEYKAQAVGLIHSSGKTIRQVAAELGMPAKTLSRWKQRQNKEPACFQKPTAQEAEVIYLKRQLKDVELEKDILKKALAICSQWKAAGRLASNS